MKRSSRIAKVSGGETSSHSQNNSISNTSNPKMTEAASMEVKFKSFIAKSSQLAGELKSQVTSRIVHLENQLALQQKTCTDLQKEKANLTRQISVLDKSNESLVKENEETKLKFLQSEKTEKKLKADLISKDDRIATLEKEKEKLLKAQNTFNNRLQTFIRDISVSDDYDLTVEETEPGTSTKRDLPLSLDDESICPIKRQRTTDSEQEISTEPNNHDKNDKECAVDSTSIIVEPYDPRMTAVDKTSIVEPYEPMMISSVCSINANCSPASNANPAVMEVNRETTKSPTLLICMSSKSRSNIRNIINFKQLSKETKTAYVQEKQRKETYQRSVKSYTETYGTLPGTLNKLNKLVLDFDPFTKRELLCVDKRLSLKLKPHQCDGVKFMWDACYESTKKLRIDGGSGCILGHCMGLGKTLQVITLVHTLMTNVILTKVRKVLIICPVNVITNWVDEFEVWLKDFPMEERIQIYELASCSSAERKKRIKSWHKSGGVLILGYRMFQNMHQNYPPSDYFEHIMFYETFIDPGADLVVCDEGHLLKNPTSKISLALNKIRTLRRIVLTGTPLQNNLKEYFSMIEFVKPRLLGTEYEFNNRFVRPIVNGQFVDSTVEDITLMKHRAYILHKLLEGCVQRRDYSVLAKFLPPKQEYVLFIRLTKVQIDLYKFYMTKMVKGNPVADLPALKRVCNHPNVLTDFKAQHKSSESSKRRDSDFDSDSDSENVRDTNLEWWKSIYSGENLGLSGKMLMLFTILTGCESRNEKLLVFSSSLSTLNVIEHFLTAKPPVTFGHWAVGTDYFRLDGTDSVEKRRRNVKSFNDETNKRARLFLISTKAGGLGINLMAANRVVIFDASWNPSDDKECFIYRFVALGTMEEIIYDRQVSKLSTAKRVIDEHQIGRHYKAEDLQQLYCIENLDPPVKQQELHRTEDPLLNSILQTNSDVVYKYHDHDSLLENVTEETLTDKEIGDVWEQFEANESDYSSDEDHE